MSLHQRFSINVIKTHQENGKNTVKGVIFNLTVILSGLAILLTRITSKTRPVGDLNIFLPSEV